MIIVGGDELVSTGEIVFLPKDNLFEGVTPINVVYMQFNKKDMKKYKELIDKGMSLALHAADLRELVYICNLGAKYAVSHKEDAHTMQKAVDNYLFDTRLLVLVYEEEEIEWAVTNEIDGVLFATEEME